MIPLKTPTEIEIMAEGGKKLARVKNILKEGVQIGVKASDIENLAVSLIKEERAGESFKMVPGYSWATCVNVNDGLVHGIPKEEIVFKKGDVVSVDVGLFYKGFHTDTSITVGLEVDGETKRFLEVGQEALKKAIDQVKVGRHIWHISKTIEQIIKEGGYSPIKALVGHGVGKELHEEPQIPCFVPGRVEDSPRIEPGMVLAIEVMYTQGSPNVIQLPDGWTIAMADGKISGLFEETVAVSLTGSRVLTQ